MIVVILAAILVAFSISMEQFSLTITSTITYGIMVIALIVEKLGFLKVGLLAMEHKITNIIILVMIAVTLLLFIL